MVFSAKDSYSAHTSYTIFNLFNQVREGKVVLESYPEMGVEEMSRIIDYVISVMEIPNVIGYFKWQDGYGYIPHIKSQLKVIVAIKRFLDGEFAICRYSDKYPNLVDGIVGKKIEDLNMSMYKCLCEINITCTFYTFYGLPIEDTIEFVDSIISFT